LREQLLERWKICNRPWDGLQQLDDEESGAANSLE
jgi:hypothetical protein